MRSSKRSAIRAIPRADRTRARLRVPRERGPGREVFPAIAGFSPWRPAAGRNVAAAREPTRGTCVARSLYTEPEAAMNVRPSILCPIDYSDASAGALRYAAAIAEHFVTRLIVLTVEDPLLTTAMDLGIGVSWTPETSEREIARFVADTFAGDAATLAMCEYDVAVGKPPVEILRVARERSCDL